ncbi:glutamyl-tRNA synthetase [Sphaerochaeta pleomorpha str. Grapes]|uniref:Glutamate--tRNA ligase n=1 Tax=Sphaerochaeta pleomorpha (strain ATCC BAA-1885 / DSM 22778 / Grapes) TaxID=158190 RepID=G8QYA6_SPHPG|nr:glutamate--tRNA ligase [Sphaerochaeta pleomorpha]AEV30753.1 glutamyl-tRNA synthetase [Sphaerochaeta pleomorpha str. Grapes]
MEVRVRYAPSPTGLQHIGGVRTALFNYFFARANGGKFILRVEDTDQERYSDESLQDLYDTLSWLGISWDEGPIVGGPCGPYIQSERFELYKKYAEQLVRDGKAYYCYCSSERLEQLRSEQQAAKSEQQGYDRHCRTLTDEQRSAYERQGIKPVIRLKVPLDGKTTFHDVLMGDITRRNRDVSPDPVLLKSDGFPTYHLANVIDDHMMGITHIMRAQEWIPSGPLHILLYEAFGWEPPLYCHLPMVMGKDGQKLSKRHGSTSVRDFREKGYLPEALMNYVSLVGWSYDGQREFFSKQDLEQLFCLEKINKAPGVFDYKKLDWFNGQYIRQKDDAELSLLLLPYLEKAGFVSLPLTETQQERLSSLVPAVKERMKVLSDVVELSRFLFEEPNLCDPSAFCGKGVDLPTTFTALEKAYAILRNGLETGLEDSIIESQLVDLATSMEIKVNGVFMPIRVAITGSSVSLPLFDSIRLLGQGKTFDRIEKALALLKSEVR